MTLLAKGLVGAAVAVVALLGGVVALWRQLHRSGSARRALLERELLVRLYRERLFYPIEIDLVDSGVATREEAWNALDALHRRGFIAQHATCRGYWAATAAGRREVDALMAGDLATPLAPAKDAAP